MHARKMMAGEEVQEDRLLETEELSALPLSPISATPSERPDLFEGKKMEIQHADS